MRRFFEQRRPGPPSLLSLSPSFSRETRTLGEWAWEKHDGGFSRRTWKCSIKSQQSHGPCESTKRWGKHPCLFLILSDAHPLLSVCKFERLGTRVSALWSSAAARPTHPTRRLATRLNRMVRFHRAESWALPGAVRQWNV